MAVHKAVGHGGFKKTEENLSRNYFWEAMNFDIAKTLDCWQDFQKDKSFKKSTLFQLVEPKFS